MLKALTLDPGVTTGYCLSVIEDPQRVYLSYGERQLSLRQIWDSLYKISADVIICEDFEYRNRARSGLNLFPVKVIGVVELWASPIVVGYGQTEAKGHDIIFQKASEGKGHFKDERLKQLGVYKKGVSHGRDACRHFLHWLQFGSGFQYVEEPQLDVVEENWILGAYWDHTEPWR